MHTDHDFIGLILHGSVMKEDFLPDVAILTFTCM